MNIVLKTDENQSILMQVSKFGAIPTTGGNFSMPDGSAFLVKNDTDTPVSLTVMPALGNTLVTTNFSSGWNPELVREVVVGPSDLLWGQ